MIVRRITANLFNRHNYSQLRSTKAFVAITNAAGQFYALPTEAFEDYQGTDTSRYIFEIPPIVDGSVYCSIPFPETITEVGAYSVRIYYQNQLPGNIDSQDLSSGRLIRPPEPSSLLGHYSAKQPPYGAVLDTYLYATRSLKGAWALTGGVAPVDFFHQNTLMPGSKNLFSLSIVEGKTCAHISPDLYGNNGCSLKGKRGFSRNGTSSVFTLP